MSKDLQPGLLTTPHRGKKRCSNDAQDDDDEENVQSAISRHAVRGPCNITMCLHAYRLDGSPHHTMPQISVQKGSSNTAAS